MHAMMQQRNDQTGLKVVSVLIQLPQTENLVSDHGYIIFSQPCNKQGLPMLSHYLTLE